MFHGLDGWEAALVGVPAFLMGSNCYFLDQYFTGSLFAVPTCMLAATALGAALGEGLSQVVYSTKYSGRGKVVLTRMVYTGLAAAVGAALGGGLLSQFAPNLLSGTVAGAAIGALTAVIWSGKLGFVAPVTAGGD